MKDVFLLYYYKYSFLNYIYIKIFEQQLSFLFILLFKIKICFYKKIQKKSMLRQIFVIIFFFKTVRSQKFFNIFSIIFFIDIFFLFGNKYSINNSLSMALYIKVIWFIKKFILMKKKIFPILTYFQCFN